MARVVNQSIPSELYAGYTRTLARVSSSGRVSRRYPYRLPHMQSGSPRVSQAAQAQRERFKAAAAIFAAMPEAQRERYYAAAPEWNSVLWYYNYAIMSALAGNANADAGGYGVIKSIQNVSGVIAAEGITTLTIAAIDPAKAVVMLYGASYISDYIQRGSGTCAKGGTATVAIDAVDPSLCSVIVEGEELGIYIPAEGDGDGYASVVHAQSLAPELLTVKCNGPVLSGSLAFYWEVREHRSQTVYPVVHAIESEAVKLKWSLEPSQGAIVSATVIEYI